MTEPPVIRRLVHRLSGRPLIQNNARGELVEEMVAMALEPEWQLCGGDWGSHDLERTDGLRIQVKQSAARQSWHEEDSKPSRGNLSIASKEGRWADDGSWIYEAGRNAEIFVLGWHPVTDPSADHRAADQWQFYVIAEHRLPQQSSIALSTLQTLSDAVTVRNLAHRVREVAALGLAR